METLRQAKDGVVRLVLLALGVLAFALAAQPAAAVPRDDFALGQSARSGAVCKAVRDFDDPLSSKAGWRAWSVMCRGWSQQLGRVYAFHDDEAAATAAWRAALAPPLRRPPGSSPSNPW